MRVTLATSPHVRHPAVLQGDFIQDPSVMYSFAPVGLLSIAAMLRRDRPTFHCELYDVNRRILAGVLPLDRGFYKAAAADLCAGGPDVIGFMTECDSYHHVLQIVEAVKEIRPSCAIVLGGPHASVVARETIERCKAVDVVVVGEGEISFPILLDALSSGSKVPVAGTMTRGCPDGVTDGGTRELIERLDDLPFPAYDLYHPDSGEEIFVEVGRGCPFKCEFCSTAPFWKRRHRVKSPERVLREIQLLCELFGTSRVHFTHDLFTTDRDWVGAVCETLIAAGVPVRWTCSARTDTVDSSLLSLMARAGCNAIYFGIESGSARILREIHKEIPLDQSFAIIEACHREQITPNVGFIVGFPTEDERSLRETLSTYERALRSRCRPAHIFGFCPFAGSSMYASLRDLRCGGHFVDLPLGLEVDLANRHRVMNDSTMYGAYFRPHLPTVVPGVEDAVYALDEFSPLVEASLVPTLALSEQLGGMYEVFRAWLGWIHTYNDERQVPAYRRGYGTPVCFAQFVLEELTASTETSPSMISAARAVLTNLRVAQMVCRGASTTMASYRSLVLPEIAPLSGIALSTQLSRGPILATLSLEYDPIPALLGQVDVEMPEEQAFIVWQVTADRDVRLLRVDQTIFDALEILAIEPTTVGELFLERLNRREALERATASDLDLAAMLTSLGLAAREGLLAIGDR